MEYIKNKIKRIISYLERNLLSDKLSCNLKFRLTFGRWIDWNNPKSFEEKIQWRKIYGMKQIFTTYTDKYLVREYIKNKIGEEYLIPLIIHTDNPKNINFDKLPNSFIIKMNNNEAPPLIVRNKEKINKKEIIEYYTKALKKNKVYSLWRENQYKGIKPKVLIEELLIDEKEIGKIPRDYKFHCFNGRVEMIQVDIDRFDKHKRCILNRKGEILPFSFSPVKNGKLAVNMINNIQKPKLLKKMILIAEAIAKDFDYIRVDLYNINKRIYFGELTFTPGGGFERFMPISWDYYFGNLWDIRK